MSESIGPLIIDIATTALSGEDREILAHPLVGGVIFFTRNFENPVQMRALCQEIRASRKTPLLLMVDHEGGRVQRFKNGLTHLPPMGLIGSIYDTDADFAVALAKSAGQIMAYELLSLGIDLSLAPVLDLNRGLNKVIGDRSFHSDPKVVSRLASALIAGMRIMGMAPVVKHFPGHGGVTNDSHHELPKDMRDWQTVCLSDCEAFIDCFHEINAVMAGHLLFPLIDHESVCYSHKWMQTILREKLQFTGLVMSDDLHMEGANQVSSGKDRFLRARIAGCDIILYCNDRKAVMDILDQVSPEGHVLKLARLETLFGKWNTLQNKSLEIPKSHKRFFKISETYPII